ncbi:4'-phosphopantetheinyl transferase superfamily protein [Marinobacter sp. chi1]|uniref:4'-phosphopantetheinyl transferase superfamily protein n=1 Tax=Marinobacter suaedae TaxID=3057675 RepID=A0ABT8VZT8_9GAMM|nr:4'-phosphopantetheinyl transferase superfamily protein [Marinobacter sp. chi1]MDO3721513.1 4'-phosphopantetheinyl transferase superfamily protein [Marinobacter sp. chi1]
MAGPFSDSSPDQLPSIWLCQEGSTGLAGEPPWLIRHERETLRSLTGLRRSEYLLSRWLIRQALAGASNQPADACRPVSGRLVRSEAPEGWRLSLSHSQGLVACATSHGVPVGIDLEPIQRKPRWQSIVRRWFSLREQAWLLEADDPMAFLTVWTLKEAWLKATGRGIAGNLQTLEVLPGFELIGDRPEPDWQACCFRLPHCLVTLVWKGTTNGLPAVHQVSAPQTIQTLSGSEHRQLDASVALRQTIQSMHVEQE